MSVLYYTIIYNAPYAQSCHSIFHLTLYPIDRSQTKPVKVENRALADASYSLSSVMLELVKQQGPKTCDILEAEMLARKSIRIKNMFDDVKDFTTSPFIDKLSKILQLKGNHDDEEMELLKQLLNTAIAQEYDGNEVAVANYNLAMH